MKGKDDGTISTGTSSIVLLLNKRQVKMINKSPRSPQSLGCKGKASKITNDDPFSSEHNSSTRKFADFGHQELFYKS